MKKILLSALVCSALFSSNSHAQLPDGSIAPDWTLTDINGDSHNLYTLLDNGYTVVIDLNATWCPPCWSYHESGELEDLWVNHGPAGGNGVSANTTDDVYVFMVESDGSTTSADLNGTTEGTMGDWVTGTMFPIIDDNSISGPYGLNFFPTIYTICPNRQMTRVGGQTGAASATAIYSHVGTCLSVSGDVNGALLAYTGESISCGSPVTVSVDLQNLGNQALTSATIEVMDGATSVHSYDWTGELATYDVANVTVGTVTPLETTTYSIKITSADDDASDNSLTQTIAAAAETNYSITVEFLTDDYADESYLELTNSNGDVVWFEGNENVSGNFDTGEFPAPADATAPLTNNTQYSWYVNLPAEDCYTLTVYDFYGDGIGASQWGGTDGSWSVSDNNGATLISMSAADFGGSDQGLIKNLSVSLVDLDLANINVYPNPATDVVNISMENVTSETLVTIMDLQGRILATEAASNTNGSQVITFDTEGFAKGTYVVSVRTNGLTSNTNIVIK